jgi:hypothetical protein
LSRQNNAAYQLGRELLVAPAVASESNQQIVLKKKRKISNRYTETFKYIIAKNKTGCGITKPVATTDQS